VPVKVTSRLAIVGLVVVLLVPQLAAPATAGAHRGLVGVTTGATSQMILETSGIQCTFDLDAGAATGATGTCSGNNVNVRVVTSAVEHDGGVLSLGLAVQNVGELRLATRDGTTPDTAGVWLFVASGPFVIAGTGQAEILNADGVGDFTGADQPYFQYAGALLGTDGILTPGEASSTKVWRLSTAGDVAQVGFSLGVLAEVPPSETPTPTGTPSPDPRPTLTATDTPTLSNTPTSEPTATSTTAPSNTPASTHTPTLTPTATSTVLPASTATNTPSTAPTRTPRPTKPPKPRAG